MALAGDPTITPAEKQVLNSVVQAPLLAGHVARYSGAQPLDETGVVITSRHCVHPDNATAVAAWSPTCSGSAERIAR